MCFINRVTQNTNNLTNRVIKTKTFVFTVFPKLYINFFNVYATHLCNIYGQEVNVTDTKIWSGIVALLKYQIGTPALKW